MSKTFLQTQQLLARAMGDAASDGTAAYAKWSQQEYKDAINFATQLLRERYLIPTGADLSWVTDTYDYAVPGSLVYLYSMRAESNSGISMVGPVAGSGLFEYEVGLDVVSVEYSSAGVLQLHFDKNEVFRQNLNQSGLKIRCEGYKYQAEMTADADVLYVNWPAILLLAKQYLHLAAAGRDPNDLMKHLRQWQAVAAEIAANPDDDYERPGGIWLDK